MTFGRLISFDLDELVSISSKSEATEEDLDDLSIMLSSTLLGLFRTEAVNVDFADGEVDDDRLSRNGSSLVSFVS